MKNVLLVLAMVCSLMLQAQTLREVANEYLGLMPSKSITTRIKTDYGTLPFKMKCYDKKIIKIVVTISNDNIFYDSIVNNKTNGEVRVSKLWTEFKFKYEDGEKKHKSYIGVEGGLGFISLNRTDNFYFSGNAEKFAEKGTGFVGAITFQYNFTNLISFRTNVAYERKGEVAKVTAHDYGNGIIQEEDYKYLRYFDYITVPLLIRFSFGNKVKLFINTGGYVGYLIRQTNTTYKGTNEVLYAISHNRYKYKDFDFGITVGIGATIPINDKFIASLELRNSISVYNIKHISYVAGHEYANIVKTESAKILLGIAYIL